MKKEMELCVYCAQKLDGTLDMQKRQWPVFGKCANCGKETVVQPFTVGRTRRSRGQDCGGRAARADAIRPYGGR